LAALARATNLRTLILDEPDAFLDRLNVGRLVKLIGLLREEGRQVLVVSHKE
jgi:DNA repair exonuclease SbcCD ATPase subunit